MTKMKIYTHEEVLDNLIGKKGTPARDAHDQRIQEFIIGEAIKSTRKEQHLTQAQLGELLGVNKSEVSRIEKGKNLTFATIVKVFKALGAKTASLDLGAGFGKVALW